MAGLFKLNRRTEYALLALRYLSFPGQPVASVHVVAQHYGLPEPLLAKVLQLLKRGGITTATKGAAGGYTLARSLTDVTLAEILTLFDESTDLVKCVEQPFRCECHLRPNCEIRHGMVSLNQLLKAQLQGLSVAMFFAGETQTATN